MNTNFHQSTPNPKALKRTPRRTMSSNTFLCESSFESRSLKREPRGFFVGLEWRWKRETSVRRSASISSFRSSSSSSDFFNKLSPHFNSNQPQVNPIRLSSPFPQVFRPQTSGKGVLASAALPPGLPTCTLHRAPPFPALFRSSSLLPWFCLLCFIFLLYSMPMS